MFRYFVNIIFVILLFSLQTKAQDFITDDENNGNENQKKEQNLIDKLMFGGGITINFWGDPFEIGTDPIVGYKLNDNTVVGIGLFYDYQQSQHFNYRASIFGGKVFARRFVYQNFFLQSEFERLHIKMDELMTFKNIRNYSYDGLYVGVGYNFSQYRNSGLTLMILYDLLYNENSIYNSPISIRVGLNF